MKNIIIIGGGTGGTMCANALLKRINPKTRKDWQITVIDKSEYHAFQPDYLHVAFNGMKPDKLFKKERSLLFAKIKFLHDTVTKVDLKSQTVATEISGILPYDYIVIAPGSMPNYDMIPGLRESNLDFHTSPQDAEKIYETLKTSIGGRFVVGVAGVPYKCPPSPNESAFLLHDFLKKRKMLDNSSIIFVTPYPKFYTAPAISEITEKVAKAKNIEIVTSFNLDHVDVQGKKLVSMEGNEIKFDYLFMVPPHKALDFIKGEEFTDKDGWIKVDKTSLKIEGYENAFAIGDVTNAPTAKSGMTAHLEAEVVTSTIADQINNMSDKEYMFTGRTHCPFEVGDQKAVFVIGTYDRPAISVNPSFENYMLKKIMGKIYWSTLKGSFTDIFKIYFGEDYMKVVKKQ